SVREQDVRTLILVPTKELGQQVQTMMRQLTSYCSRDVRVADISGKADVSTQRPILMEKPDVVVGTPSRVLAHLNAQNLALQSSLEMLVVDEADLVFSFGFDHLPKIYQSFLMSATFNEDVQALKELLLHNPVTLKLQGSQLPDSTQLQQYTIKCEEEDKFLLIYTLLKLHLVQGKTLLFVGAVDRSYRLKLFLEQFGIPACVLNSELPVQSRCHIISQFNQGFYDIIIATDEQSLVVYSILHTIQTLSLFSDCRTARADNPGTALSFISHTELSALAEVEEALGGDKAESALKPYEFRMEEIEGFRYRCRDAMRAVTKQAVREARLKEIKQELLNSEKLKVRDGQGESNQCSKNV
ncbi:hypothetical protein GOODEAATRI_024673, partial [Goodea atripinnis]